MTNRPCKDAEQVRYLAHAQASREFEQANPDYNPWHATPGQRAPHDTYVASRVADIPADHTN